MDELCDAFEAAWSANQRPEIEQFLAQSPVADRGELLCELLSIELFYRMKGGEQPSSADYLPRFPELNPAWMDQVTQSLRSAETWPAAGDQASDSQQPRHWARPAVHHGDIPAIRNWRRTRRYRTRRLSRVQRNLPIWMSCGLCSNRPPGLPSSVGLAASACSRCWARAEWESYF
jgi:hypothetical protein